MRMLLSNNKAVLAAASRSPGLPSQPCHVKRAFHALVTSPHPHGLLHWSTLNFPKYTSRIFPTFMLLHPFPYLLKTPFATCQNPTTQEEIGYQATYIVHSFSVCFLFFLLFFICLGIFAEKYIIMSYSC